MAEKSKRNQMFDTAVDSAFEIHGLDNTPGDTNNDEPPEKKDEKPKDGAEGGGKSYNKMTVADLKSKLSPEDQATLDELLAKC